VVVQDVFPLALVVQLYVESAVGVFEALTVVVPSAFFVVDVVVPSPLSVVVVFGSWLGKLVCATVVTLPSLSVFLHTFFLPSAEVVQTEDDPSLFVCVTTVEPSAFVVVTVLLPSG
jgi:hypothetical protein